MSNTIRPAAGLEIAFFCVVVILGILTPLVVLCASKIAEAFGELVPIPTLPLESIRIFSVGLLPFAVFPKVNATAPVAFSATDEICDEAVPPALVFVVSSKDACVAVVVPAFLNLARNEFAPADVALTSSKFVGVVVPIPTSPAK